MTAYTASVIDDPCGACGVRPAIRGSALTPAGVLVRLPGRFCALCLATLIDHAHGWKIRNNVAQGLAGQQLGLEIQAAKKRRKVRAS